MTTTTAPSDRLAGSPRRWPLGGHRSASIASAAGYLLLGFPLAIVAFVLVVTFGAVAFGLLPIYPVALGLLVVWLAIVHGAAAIERALLRATLGVEVAPPPALPRSGGWHARLWATIRHATTWRATAYHVVRLPLVILTFTAAVIAIWLPIALMILPLALVGAQLSYLSLPMVLAAVAGPFLSLAILPLAAQTIQALAILHAAVADQLLTVSPSDERERRIDQLRSTRSEMVDIAEQERRRIERDLHDGAGQQLVSLAMTLGMAREKLVDDPQRAQALIDEAHLEAKQALVGLRDIVRGISPAILTDRGLGAALSAVAARSAVPVALEVEVPERPDPVTEGIAYYLVCEGIGNAIRHAGASSVRVSIVRRGDVLEVAISDDGCGGADPARGTGLRGLAGRVAAVDGHLGIVSPPGAGTTLRATIPIRAGDEPTSDVTTSAGR